MLEFLAFSVGHTTRHQLTTMSIRLFIMGRIILPVHLFSLMFIIVVHMSVD